MNNIDLCLLIGSLTAIGIVFVLPRHAIFGPFILAWVGVAVGGTVALVYHYDLANDRVSPTHLLAHVLIGSTCGLVPGLGVQAIYLRSSHRLRGVIEVFVTALLFAGWGMVWGWLAGDKREDNPPAGMFRSTVIGGIIGALAGLIQWRLHGTDKTAPGVTGQDTVAKADH